MSQFSTTTWGAGSSNLTIAAEDGSDIGLPSLDKREPINSVQSAPHPAHEFFRAGIVGPSTNPHLMQVMVDGYGDRTEDEARGMRRDTAASSSSSDVVARSSRAPSTSEGQHGEDTSESRSPRRSVGFWDDDLRQTRKEATISWLKTTTILSIFILAVLSIYWGALYNVERKFDRLNVFVVDFDAQTPLYSNVTAIVGPKIVAAAERQNSKRMPHLGFQIKHPSEFDNNPMEVRQAIYDFKAWGAIIVNDNATSLLQAAITGDGNSSYDPLGAAQTFFVEARGEPTVRVYVYPSLIELQSEIVAEFGIDWAQTLFRNNFISRSTLEMVPQAVNPAIGFSMYNLRPFGPAAANPAVSIGLIYLIIVAFFSFSFFMPIHLEYIDAAKHPPLHFYQLILWRWCSTIGAYLIMSLCYSLVPLAFQVSFSNRPGPTTEVTTDANSYGAATFPVYWMLNFFGMAALGLACENVAMIIGTPWTAMWLIFWVITNVCTSFYALDLAPEFYNWGYAWPLHNIVEASRQLLFDLHSRIWLNFFVLWAWCAVNTVLFPFCCIYMRRKTRQRSSQKGPSPSNGERPPRRFVVNEKQRVHEHGRDGSGPTRQP